MTETRVVNAKTGGEKGAKPSRMSLVPMDVILRHVAPHYVKGAEKYAPDNWRRGYDWSLSFDALCRHLEAFWYERQENDEETGTRHLAAVVFHALALLYFGDEHPDLDDRPELARGRAAADEAEPRLDAQAPSWAELEAEPMAGPCPFPTLNPDGRCSMAQHFGGGHAQCRRSCESAAGESRS